MMELDSAMWWEASSDDLHSQIQATYKVLKAYDQRADAYSTYESLYSNRDIHDSGFAAHYHSATNVRQQPKYSRVPFNLIKLIVDTVSARIAKVRPRPTFLTEGGNFTLRRKAKRLQKWVDMQFYNQRTYQVAARAFIDACIFGIGIVKTYSRGEEVISERVYPGELMVDEYEAFHGEPRTIYQTKFVSRSILLRDFPEAKDIIETAGRACDTEMYDVGYRPTMDQVEVVEAWHLPTSEDAGDGRKVIFVSSGVLDDVEYKHHDFPFSSVYWVREIRGFYGIGLAEELMGIHRDINTTIEKIERGLELAVAPQVWVESSSKVTAKQITDIPGSINTYSGQPPKFMVPQAVQPEAITYLNMLVGRAMQIARLSDVSFGSRIPSGLETGQAVRDYHDIESESFALPARQYEEFFLDIARKMVRAGKEIHMRNPRYTVVLAQDKYTIEKVPWKDIHIDDRKEALVSKVFPASSLSQTPSGRKNDIQDLINMGMISPQEGKRLLDFPDLEESSSLDRVAADSIDASLEKIRDEGIYTAPDPYTDLELAMLKAQGAVNEAVLMGVPENRITMLRIYVRQASALKKRAQQEAAIMQAGGINPAAPPPPGPDGVPPTAVTGGEL